MIPRHSNPHLLSQAFSVQKVSRNLLFQESCSTTSHSQSLEDVQTIETEVNEQERADLLKRLNKRVLEEFEFNLGPSYENERKDTIQDLPPDDADQGKRKSKRRKLENSTKKEDASFPFRLFSRTEKTILLEPGPPKPPPCYREPSYEDSPSEAQSRRERAQSIAVDYAWILNESKREYKPFPSTTPKLSHGTIKASSYSTPTEDDGEDSWPPVTMIIHRLQPPRGTRPPVPRTMLRHHPYALEAHALVEKLDFDADKNLSEQKIASRKNILTADLVADYDRAGDNKRRRRRRRARPTVDSRN
ncbi:hypothetical protein VKT23_003863 [Stygiomarasmius scandens]|uniref:Uncharacterized protein n=1 Tax=Marasmiellus scandens TaxID=2682957 RepID=A0ABR1K060_9AGAR